VAIINVDTHVKDTKEKASEKLKQIAEKVCGETGNVPGQIIFLVAKDSEVGMALVGTDRKLSMIPYSSLDQKFHLWHEYCVNYTKALSMTGVASFAIITAALFRSTTDSRDYDAVSNGLKAIKSQAGFPTASDEDFFKLSIQKMNKGADKNTGLFAHGEDAGGTTCGLGQNQEFARKGICPRGVDCIATAWGPTKFNTGPVASLDCKILQFTNRPKLKPAKNPGPDDKSRQKNLNAYKEKNKSVWDN